MTLPDAVDRLMANEGVLLGVDFDGTLAPIVDHPDDAEPDQEALRLVRQLAQGPGVEVAVVSGRSLTDLRARLGEIPGATLVGEHGNDIEGPVLEPSPVLTEAGEFVDVLQARFAGSVVEKKQHSVTFHTRHLDRDQASEAAGAIHRWMEGRDDIEVIAGKEVYELSTATRNKGDAIRELAGGRPVIYLGDDTTDETVFEALGPGDVGVKVGDGPTAAAYRVEDIAGVVTILERIALASR